jgi:hypothetical protein
MFRLCTALLLAGLASACVDDATASDSSAVATAAEGSGGCHRPPRPPQAAIDACANQSAGASCAFDIDSHHVTGTCRQGPNGNGPLACAPDGGGQPPPPPPGGGGSGDDCGPPRPPQAALDACANLSAGDACAFDLDSHHITGTCRQGPNSGGPLACAPDQPPPR